MKGALRIAGWVVAVLIALPCIGSMGAMWIAELPVQLAAGWAFFLVRVLPEVSVRPAAVLEAVLVLAALGVGLHLFMRWLWPQWRSQESGTPAWPVRWSVSMLSLLVLLFLSAMATVGIGHHVGWLASGRAPLLESSWGFGFESFRQASVLCDEAIELSKGGAADESIGGMLLAREQTRVLMEKLTVVPLRKAGGEVAFLVIPRDPASLRQHGLVRCGGGLPEYKREGFQAAMLPRLLAGEELTGEQAY
jgi:hypothetical protein